MFLLFQTIVKPRKVLVTVDPLFGIIFLLNLLRTLTVFLTTGGMSKECKRFVNRVARKRKARYCDVVKHVRTRIRFAMLRTTLIALRGYRGKKMDRKN